MENCDFFPIKQHQESYSSGDHATEDVFPESHGRQEDLLLLHLPAPLALRLRWDTPGGRTLYLPRATWRAARSARPAPLGYATLPFCQ